MFHSGMFLWVFGRGQMSEIFMRGVGGIWPAIELAISRYITDGMCCHTQACQADARCTSLRCGWIPRGRPNNALASAFLPARSRNSRKAYQLYISCAVVIARTAEQRLKVKKASMFKRHTTHRENEDQRPYTPIRIYHLMLISIL